ncbi:hypothetical protein [Streptomyces sp. NPDC059949]|uniref:hypothetical protein n=1 Tax=Streptomyces sp. NPDC059949 TaxID=3347013 RepID=UPI0036500AB5
MRELTREYEGPATVGGLDLPKVRIQEGVEESDWSWERPGELTLAMRWWEGEALGNDPHVLRTAYGLLEGPVDVVLPTGRAVAYLTLNVTHHVGEMYPQWEIGLQGAGRSPLG